MRSGVFEAESDCLRYEACGHASLRSTAEESSIWLNFSRRPIPVDQSEAEKTKRESSARSCPSWRHMWFLVWRQVPAFLLGSGGAYNSSLFLSLQCSSETEVAETSGIAQDRPFDDVSGRHHVAVDFSYHC